MSSKWHRKPAEWHPMAIRRTARSTAAPGDAIRPRAGAPSKQTQDGPWWRAQRRPPRDCREIRLPRLEARVRNPSRPASNPSLAHARGHRACNRRCHLPYSASTFSPGVGHPMVQSAASAASWLLREVRVTRGGGARIRNPSLRRRTRAFLAHGDARGRRACTRRRHLPQSECAFSPGAGRPTLVCAAGVLPRAFEVFHTACKVSVKGWPRSCGYAI